MDFKDNKIINLLKQRKKIFLSRNNIIFAVFLVISAFLWLLNSLNKEYTHTIDYPLKIKNMPEGVNKNKIPSHLSLKVSGHGYNILALKLDRSKAPIVINLNNYSLNRFKKDIFFLTTDKLINPADRQIKDKLEVISIKPDTLKLRIIKLTSKKIPVNLKSDYTLARQFMIIDEPYIKPDSVNIKGPEHILNNTDSLFTKLVELKNINSNINRYIPVQKPDDTKVKPDHVKLRIEVDKFTEISSEITVETINLPDSLNIELMPEDVKITYRVSLSEYKDIDDNSFVIKADFKAAKNGFLYPMVIEKPDNIKQIDINPKKIKYIINK